MVLIVLALAAPGCGSRSGLAAFGLDGDGGSSGSSSLGGATDAGAGTPGAAATAGPGGSTSGGAAGAAGSVASGGAAGSGGGGSGGGGATAGASGQAGSGGKGNAPPATLLALGAFHTCAGFADGSLRCWGTGRYIGSGDDETIGDDEAAHVAGDVDIGGSVLQVTANWYHTCTLLDSGNLRCFGTGLGGRLGYGNTEWIGDDESPASAGNVSVGGQVSQVSAGTDHTCVCYDNGKVRCWGRNDSWQLGYASSEPIGDSEPPTSAGYVDVGGFVVQVAAGYAHTCALLDDGNVRCWGRADGGMLGYVDEETIGDDETPAEAGNVDIGGKATQIVAGMFHTCALLEGGNVRCWGRATTNFIGSNGMVGAGMLGYGNTENIGDTETPASAGNVDVGGSVVELAAGAFGTCALLTTGNVRCWGWGENGLLGYVNVESVGDTETPAEVGDVDVGGVVVHIGMGFLHTCAILENGAVRCWGRASTGALGYGNVEDIGDTETPASAGDVKTH